MTEFRIDDMPCRHCASAISRAVWSLDAAATVEIDHASKRVRVESPLGPYKLAAAIAGAGFAPSAVRRDEADFPGDALWHANSHLYSFEGQPERSDRRRECFVA